MAAFVFFLLFALLSIPIVRDIYSKFDHCHWDNGATPCESADIRGVDIDKVQYTKNNAKFKTTVYFYDGFRFVTHKTNRQDHFINYVISVDKEAVIRRAKIAHKKALDKLRKNGVHIYTDEELSELKKPHDLPLVAPQPIPQRGWRCPCGRAHQAYESSCVCGFNKRNAQKQ